MNKTLEQYLRAMVCDNLRQWLQFLPWDELWYNTWYHHSLGTTPSQVVYGRPPPELIAYVPRDSLIPVVDQELCRKNQLLKVFCQHLLSTQTRMKYYVDQKRKRQELQMVNGYSLSLGLTISNQLIVAAMSNLTINFTSLRYFRFFMLVFLNHTRARDNPEEGARS